jgi:hypothetical protein
LGRAEWLGPDAEPLGLGAGELEPAATLAGLPLPGSREAASCGTVTAAAMTTTALAATVMARTVRRRRARPATLR